MTMSNTLQKAFIHTYFQGLIPKEHEEYLQLHYGDREGVFSIQPPMLSVWFKEDPDQFLEESFDYDENIERRRLRMHLSELACGADEMHRDKVLTATEVLAIYDVLYRIYLSRTCSKSCRSSIIRFHLTPNGNTSSPSGPRRQLPLSAGTFFR